MQQSKAFVIKNATRNLKATIAMRKAEYAQYRYNTRKPAMPPEYPWSMHRPLLGALRFS